MAIAHDDVVKGRNLMANAVDHSSDDTERQEKANGSQEKSAPRAVGNTIVNHGAEGGAMQECEQRRDHGRENQEEKSGIVHEHGPLELGDRMGGKSTQKQRITWERCGAKTQA